MVKSGNKTDERILEALNKLFELFKEGAKEGKYYIFTSDDVLADKVSLESRKTALTVAEGLHALGKAVYFVIKGRDEDTERSFKIDGYLPVKSASWPMLEVMLSKTSPTIERVEERVVKPAPPKMPKMKQRKNAKRPPDKGAKDAEEFLDKVFEWLEEQDPDQTKDWVWSYDKEDSLVDMNSSIGRRLLEAGFIDKTEGAIFMSDMAVDGTGIESLKKALEGNFIISIYDEDADRWYLKVY